MADGVKISQLPGASTPSDSDVVAGVQSGTTKKFSFANIYAWLKARLVPEDIGAVPDSRTVNGKALSSDISLTASDVGARPDTWFPTAAQVGARPDTWTPSAQDVGAVPVAAVGVAGGVPNLDEIGRVPQNQLPPYPTVPAASTSNPQDLGTASPGLSGDYARADHVHDMPSASDVGALAVDGTAILAEQLSSRYIISGAAGWYHLLDVSCILDQTRLITLYIKSTASSGGGILQIYLNRTPGGTTSGQVQWLTTSYTSEAVRWSINSNIMSIYFRKGSTISYTNEFYVLSATNRVGTVLNRSIYTWIGTAISEPTTANSVIGSKADLDGNGDQIDTTYLKSTGILYYKNQTLSTGNNAQLLSISAAEISDAHVLSKIDFANPEYITTGYTWTTADGSFKLVGTCTAATTANILLVRKGN